MMRERATPARQAETRQILLWKQALGLLLGLALGAMRVQGGIGFMLYLVLVQLHAWIYTWRSNPLGLEMFEVIMEEVMPGLGTLMLSWIIVHNAGL